MIILYFKYDANIFWKKTFIILKTTVPYSEHNCHIFGTQLSHLWPCGEESDYNTVTIVI